MSAHIFKMYLERLTFNLVRPFSQLFNHLCSYNSSHIEAWLYAIASFMNGDQFVVIHHSSTTLPTLCCQQVAKLAFIKLHMIYPMASRYAILYQLIHLIGFILRFVIRITERSRVAVHLNIFLVLNIKSTNLAANRQLQTLVIANIIIFSLNQPEQSIIVLEALILILSMLRYDTFYS